MRTVAPSHPDAFRDLIKRHLEHAGIPHPGACHLFRHAMATHRLHNSADLRSLQTILGHADLTTTQIYTHVVPDKLKEVHTATHPARLHREEEKEMSAEEGRPPPVGPSGLAPPERIEAICASIEQRTNAHLAEDERSPCYERLVHRREQLGGMLELARRLKVPHLIRFLESHKTALRRRMESL